MGNVGGWRGGGGLARSRVTTENLQVGPNTSRPFSGTCTTPDPQNHKTSVASVSLFAITQFHKLNSDLSKLGLVW